MGQSAKGIVGICPYKPNVVLANQRMSKYPALAEMAPFKTVDSFQGLEGDMSVVIFGTTRQSGPGFTSQKNRLNVMLTRQKSMLLMVGDMDVTGPLVGKKAAESTKKAAKSVRVPGPDGQMVFSKPAYLRDLLTGWHQAGRFFELRDLENEKKDQEIRDKRKAGNLGKTGKADKGKVGKADKGKAGKAVQVPGEVKADDLADLAEGEVFEVVENSTWADEMEEMAKAEGMEDDADNA